MVLADLEVIKTLLKRQSQKAINSILSSDDEEDDLKDFALESSVDENAALINIVFASFDPSEYLVNLEEGKQCTWLKHKLDCYE